MAQQAEKYLLIPAGNEVVVGDVYTIAGHDELRYAEANDFKYRAETKYLLLALNKTPLAEKTMAFDFNLKLFKGVNNPFINAIKRKYGIGLPAHWYTIYGVSDSNFMTIPMLTSDQIKNIISGKLISDFTLLSRVENHFNNDSI